MGMYLNQMIWLSAGKMLETLKLSTYSWVILSQRLLSNGKSII
jgi:hypothetical protein